MPLSPDLAELLSSDGFTKRMLAKDIAFGMLTPEEQTVLTKYQKFRDDITREEYGIPYKKITDDAVLDEIWDKAAERLREQGDDVEAIMNKKWAIEERILASGKG